MRSQTSYLLTKTLNEDLLVKYMKYIMDGNFDSTHAVCIVIGGV